MKKDDRRHAWIKSKSKEKHALKLHADPTHQVHLSTSLSSAALKQHTAHMKTVQVIKVVEGSSPSHPLARRQRADRYRLCAFAELKCHTWIESEWRQDERKQSKECMEPRKASTSVHPDTGENEWFTFCQKFLYMYYRHVTIISLKR